MLLGGGGHKLVSDFAISDHNHYRIKLSDDRAKYPGQLAGNETMSTFGGFLQNSILGISNFGNYSDVLVIRSYVDSSGGNDNAIIFNKNTRGVWHTQFEFGSTTSWGTPYLFLDSNNFNKYTPTLTGTGASGTWGISITGNASTATALTTSAGSATLPIYFSSGKPVACTASSVFSNLSNSGNSLSVTVAGQNRTLTVNYSTSAGNADTLDGLHESSFSKIYDINISSGSTVNVYDYAKNEAGTRSAGNIFSISGWTWAHSAYIKLNDAYSIDRQRYSIISCRNGNLNSTWQQQALLFIPTYDDNMIFLVQMHTGDVAGAVSTTLKRYADYDAIVSGNVASATKL